MVSMMSWDFVLIYDIYRINCIKCFCLMGFDADVTRILLDVLYVFFGDMIETADQFMSKTFSEQ